MLDWAYQFHKILKYNKKLDRQTLESGNTIFFNFSKVKNVYSERKSHSLKDKDETPCYSLHVKQYFQSHKRSPHQLALLCCPLSGKMCPPQLHLLCHLLWTVRCQQRRKNQLHTMSHLIKESGQDRDIKQSWLRSKHTRQYTKCKSKCLDYSLRTFHMQVTPEWPVCLEYIEVNGFKQSWNINTKNCKNFKTYIS